MSHEADSSGVLERILDHPALAGADRYLTGQVSAVGGVVRNTLLGRPTAKDVDLVVEGDPAPIARELAAGLRGDVRVHAPFRTAEVRRPGGLEIDLVGARTERYPIPGALPEVAAGTLEDDLLRRDLTISAIAVRLGGERRGEIVDPHGGRADLAARLVRVVRAGAFVEDPSRLVRAARYAAQLGFALEEVTAERARAAAPTLDPHSSRVLGELIRTLEEPGAPGALALLGQLGVPWLRGDAAALAERSAQIDAAAARLGIDPEPAWALLLAALTTVDADRLGIPAPATRLIAAARKGDARAGALGSAPSLSAVDDALSDLGPAGAVAALAAGCEPVVDWWARTRTEVLAIDGSDLVAAGLSGPAVGRGLRAARAAALDGLAPGRGAQLEVALQAARGSGST